MVEHDLVGAGSQALAAAALAAAIRGFLVRRPEWPSGAQSGHDATTFQSHMLAMMLRLLPSLEGEMIAESDIELCMLPIAEVSV